MNANSSVLFFRAWPAVLSLMGIFMGVLWIDTFASEVR